MAMCPTQLSLPSPRTWGGRRRGAGRKRTPGRRPSVPHRARAPHKAAHPIHVTLRASDAARCLRADRVFPAVRRAITAASREGFRQDHHLHLLVEAEDRVRLSRGIAGLAIRIARAVNRALGRRGAVWSGRYHARAITTPRAVRHAIVYILFNRRKHCAGEVGLDPCSSAPWFAGWREPPAPARPLQPSPVVTARTWLAS